MDIIKSVLVKAGLLALLSWPACSQAVTAGQTWNAFNDFYLSPTTAGWNGATSPSALGAAWGYYMANVNGFGLPNRIGTYFTPSSSGAGSQSMYQYSNYVPAGAGANLGASGWDPTGGVGFAHYNDNQGWGSSLGVFSTPWFAGAPGLSQGLRDLVWLQSACIYPAGGGEGIAPVLTWTAPETSAYTFAGQFIAGDQPGNSAAIAIVDSIGSSLLPRTGLANNATQSFSFTVSYSAGDVIQFQVGNLVSTGNAVGLQLTATAIPEPSAGMLVAAGLGAVGLSRRRSR